MNYDFTPVGGVVVGSSASKSITKKVIGSGGLISGGSGVVGDYIYRFFFAHGGPGFKVNDLIHTSRIDYTGSGTPVTLFEIYGKVTSIDAEGQALIGILNWTSTIGDYLEQYGDYLEWVRFGNTSDSSRANLIEINSSIGSNTPYISIKQNITSISALTNPENLLVLLGRTKNYVDNHFGTIPDDGILVKNGYFRGCVKVGSVQDTTDSSGNNWSISGTGAYLDKYGNFRVGNDNAYIRYKKEDSSFKIKAADFILETSHLKINSVTETILIGSASAFDTGVGIFIGNDSGYKIRMGDPTAQRFQYDGTDIIIFDKDDEEVFNSTSLGANMSGWKLTSTEFYKEYIHINSSGYIQSKNPVTPFYEYWKLDNDGLKINISGNNRMILGKAGALFGIYIDSYNYWYDDFAFRIGGATTNYLLFSFGGSLTINSDTFKLTAGTDLVIDSTAKLITLANSAMKFGYGVGGTGLHGVYVDANNYWYSDGTFKVYTDADNYISKAATGVVIKSTSFLLKAGNLVFNSTGSIKSYDTNYSYWELKADGSGFLALNNIHWDTSGNLSITGSISASSFNIDENNYWHSDGTFKIYTDADNYISKSTSLVIKSTSFLLKGGNLVFNSTGSIKSSYETTVYWELKADGSGLLASNNIHWDSAGALSVTGTITGSSFQIDVNNYWNSDGTFKIYHDADNYISKGTSFVIKATSFLLSAGNISINSTGSIKSSAGATTYWDLKADGSGDLALGKISWTSAGVLSITASLSASSFSIDANNYWNSDGTFQIYIDDNNRLSKGTSSFVLRSESFILKAGNLLLTSVGNIKSYSGTTVYWDLKADGSGLLASGNIAWTSAGAITLGGTITWNSKPSYTASEVGARPYDWVPTKSDLGTWTTYIDANGIYTGTLTANQINVSGISASNITTGTLSADRIASGSITSTKLSVSTLSAISANLGTVTAGSISGVTITSSTFATNPDGYTRTKLTSGTAGITFYNLYIDWELSSSISTDISSPNRLIMSFSGSDYYNFSGPVTATSFTGIQVSDLPSHNHDTLYSAIGHDHSGVYSAVGHDHSGVYSAVGHTHSYVPTGSWTNGNIIVGASYGAGLGDSGYTPSSFATAGHDHSGVYSPAGHDHSGVYSAVGHDHNSSYVAINTAITGATKCKITYDTKGLVTSGADLAASDLPTGIDAAKISSGNVSNTEFDYLNGVTSAIQTQLGGKLSLTGNGLSNGILVTSYGSIGIIAGWAGTFTDGDSNVYTVTDGVITGKNL
jgi:hypothetical protein